MFAQGYGEGIRCDFVNDSIESVCMSGVGASFRDHVAIARDSRGTLDAVSKAIIEQLQQDGLVLVCGDRPGCRTFRGGGRASGSRS